MNRSFAFTFGVGIITGTYSSVFIASALVVDWKLRTGETLSSTKSIANKNKPKLTAPKVKKVNA